MSKKLPTKGRKEKKMSDLRLLEEFESGKTLDEIIEEYNYSPSSKKSLSMRLGRLRDYKGRRRVKLTRASKQSDTRFVSIPASFLEEASLNPKKELIAIREPQPNAILLKIFENEEIEDKKDETYNLHRG